MQWLNHANILVLSSKKGLRVRGTEVMFFFLSENAGGLSAAQSTNIFTVRNDGNNNINTGNRLRGS